MIPDNSQSFEYHTVWQTQAYSFSHTKSPLSPGLSKMTELPKEWIAKINDLEHKIEINESKNALKFEKLVAESSVKFEKLFGEMNTKFANIETKIKDSENSLLKYMFTTIVAVVGFSSLCLWRAIPGMMNDELKQPMSQIQARFEKNDERLGKIESNLSDIGKRVDTSDGKLDQIAQYIRKQPKN